MFKLLKITGSSLLPDFREGDFVLAFKIPFLKLRCRRGDVVVFKHPRYGLMIKKIEKVSNSGTRLIVHGTHPFSIDSRNFGPIDARDTVGKVVWHIEKKNS